MVASDEVIDVHGPTYQDYIAVMSSFLAASAYNEVINLAILVCPV
jgi:hypothetical protein